MYAEPTIPKTSLTPFATSVSTNASDGVIVWRPVTTMRLCSVIVFMLTLGNYLTPTLLGGKNSLWFTEQIYTQFITRFNWEQGAAFGFLLLGLSTAIVWIGLKVTGQRFGDVMRRG